MERSKEELIEYTIKMRERGDSYRSMLNYLKNNTSDNSVIEEVIAAIDALEESEQIKAPEVKRGLPVLNIILGGLFLVSGLFLFTFLWGKGFVSTIPFIVTGIGLWTLIGGLK